MVDKNMDLFVYQSAAPVIGERLFDDDILKDINYICEEIFRKNNSDNEGNYPQKEVEDYFEEFHTVISFFKHIEIKIEQRELSWEKLLNEFISLFPQIAWTGASRESSESSVTYYFDFIPIAYKEKEPPFTINFSLALRQMYSRDIEDVENRFLKDIKKTVSNCLEPIGIKIKEERGSLSEDTKVVFPSPNTNNEIINLQEALEVEKLKVEHLKITNKKLETLIEQLERLNVSKAMKHFNKSESSSANSWSRILRIDFRKYNLLLRKAKFLEQSWIKNYELLKQTEKLTIQSKKMVYEREQIRTFKQSISAKEIYLLLDECQVIESRVKIKKGWWFVQPKVHIMKIDYDSLINKAAYFDLIQGENSLLEKLSIEGIIID